MKRTLTAVMLCVASLALVACGDDGGSTATAPTGAPTTTLPVISPPATGPEATKSVSAEDQKICQQVSDAGNQMRTKILMAGQQKAKDFTPVVKALNEFAASANKAAGDGDTAAGQAAKGLAKAAIDGSKAANPLTAMETGDFTKHFAALRQACIAGGVTIQK